MIKEKTIKFLNNENENERRKMSEKYTRERSYRNKNLLKQLPTHDRLKRRGFMEWKLRM